MEGIVSSFARRRSGSSRGWPSRASICAGGPLVLRVALVLSVCGPQAAGVRLSGSSDAALAGLKALDVPVVERRWGGSAELRPGRRSARMHPGLRGGDPIHAGGVAATTAEDGANSPGAVEEDLVQTMASSALATTTRLQRVMGRLKDDDDAWMQAWIESCADVIAEERLAGDVPRREDAQPTRESALAAMRAEFKSFKSRLKAEKKGSKVGRAQKLLVYAHMCGLGLLVRVSTEHTPALGNLFVG